jgi:DNA-binding MarR family transcriptional regulator
MCTQVRENRAVFLEICLVSWTFLTNHADALLCIARDPGVRLRDLAPMVGVTERAAQRIVNDLVAEGYVSRARRQPQRPHRQPRPALAAPDRTPH